MVDTGKKYVDTGVATQWGKKKGKTTENIYGRYAELV